MEKLHSENIVKNIVLLIALYLSYEPIHTFLTPDKFEGANIAIAGDLLVAVSILMVTACFGNFAFTYEKIKADTLWDRLLPHTTTGLLMYLIGLSAIMSVLLTRVLIGNFVLFEIGMVALYIASVLYDFWDVSRFEIKHLTPCLNLDS